MGRFYTKASDCVYHEYNQRLTKIIHALDDEVMIGKILRELTALGDINKNTSHQILIWTWRVEAQGV